MEPASSAFEGTSSMGGSSEEPERMAEAAVMALILGEHPAQLTSKEIVRALNDERLSDLVIEDAADRLERSGLAHREGDFIIPSHAALRMDRLPIEAAKRTLPTIPG
jgi:hypothetical protein